MEPDAWVGLVEDALLFGTLGDVVLDALQSKQISTIVARDLVTCP